MKYKIVYNNCYGGFCLSTKAIDWLENNASDPILKEYIKIKKEEYNNNNIINITDEKYNQKLLCYNISEWFFEKRHHSDLVNVVEVLGKEASNTCSELSIKEINSRLYYIEVYDGYEDIVIPNSKQWIIIE